MGGREESRDKLINYLIVQCPLGEIHSAYKRSAERKVRAGKRGGIKAARGGNAGWRTKDRQGLLWLSNGVG